MNEGQVLEALEVDDDLLVNDDEVRKEEEVGEKGGEEEDDDDDDDASYEYISEYDADDLEKIRSAQLESFIEAWEARTPREELHETWTKENRDFVKANEIMLSEINDAINTASTKKWIPKGTALTAGAIALWEALSEPSSSSSSSSKPAATKIVKGRRNHPKRLFNVDAAPLATSPLRWDSVLVRSSFSNINDCLLYHQSSEKRRRQNDCSNSAEQRLTSSNSNH